MRLRILAADYWVSAAKGDGLPEAPAPEIAFVGRSNVGKSSLLNTLVEQKHLVRTSNTPGQTKNVNLFRVTLGRVGTSNEVTERRDVVFADLPGYGYAKTEKTEKARLSSLLSVYLSKRTGIALVMQLVDARHALSDDDVEMFKGLRAAGHNAHLLATKIDRIPLAKRVPTLKKLVQPLGVSVSEVQAFSSVDRVGRHEVLAAVWDACVRR